MKCILESFTMQVVRALLQEGVEMARVYALEYFYVRPMREYVCALCAGFESKVDAEIVGFYCQDDGVGVVIDIGNNG